MPKVLRGELGIETWLSFLNLAQYTLPRDRLFALHGLSSLKDRTSIRIDYERPNRGIFKEAAVYLIKKCGIRVLQTGNVNKSLNLKLPSWAPDWSFQERPRPTFISSASAPYNSCDSEASWERLGTPDWKMVDESSPIGSLVRFSRDIETMAIHGLEFDVISFADSSLLESVPRKQLVDSMKNFIPMDLRPEVIKFFMFLEEKVKAFPNDPYQALCGQGEALWRSLIADRSETNQLPDSSYVDRFETLMGRRNGSQSSIGNICMETVSLQELLPYAICEPLLFPARDL